MIQNLLDQLRDTNQPRHPVELRAAQNESSPICRQIYILHLIPVTAALSRAPSPAEIRLSKRRRQCHAATIGIGHLDLSAADRPAGSLAATGLLVDCGRGPDRRALR
jgi:hypothetical protein